MKEKTTCEREFDFSLVIDGVEELTDEVMDAFFKAGCDDATFTVRYGRVFAEFSRSALSFKDSVLSAICDIKKAGIGATVARVNDCELVTQSEIARRIERSRQQVSQYISGERGPGGFPAPICHLTDRAPLWQWCAVSFWLLENNMIKADAMWDAWIMEAINLTLDTQRQEALNPQLFAEIRKKLVTTCT